MVENILISLLPREIDNLCDQYYNWLKRDPYRLDCPYSVISFLDVEGLLDVEEIKKFCSN